MDEKESVQRARDGGHSILVVINLMLTLGLLCKKVWFTIASAPGTHHRSDVPRICRQRGENPPLRVPVLRDALSHLQYRLLHRPDVVDTALGRIV